MLMLAAPAVVRAQVPENKLPENKLPEKAAAGDLVGVWALGGLEACETGTAWVLMADGLYADVKLPGGTINALGSWRDEGVALGYTHAHFPFRNMKGGLPDRRMVFSSRSAAAFAATTPSGQVQIFTRCPDGTLKEPAHSGGH